MISIDAPLTQAQFGALVGVSQQAVSDLAARGLIAHGMTGAEMLLAYCSHLREVAAGRLASGDLDLAGERARLAKEQADRIAMQNAVTRGELAPAYLIEEVLAKAGSRAAKILDTIPGMIRRRVAALTADDVTAIAGEIAKARNIAAAVSLADLRDENSDPNPADDVATVADQDT